VYCFKIDFYENKGKPTGTQISVKARLKSVKGKLKSKKPRLEIIIFET